MGVRVINTLNIVHASRKSLDNLQHKKQANFPSIFSISENLSPSNLSKIVALMHLRRAAQRL